MQQTSPTEQGASQDAPKIEFPCQYPIKIVGDAAPDFKAAVLDIVEQHAPGFDRSSVRMVDSRNGRFQSVRVVIRATGHEQLNALFHSLKATGRVHMVM
ncbi:MULTISPECIES: HP0495 family protein [Chromohalobacter]|uniref:UPF0250 protein Csal_1550 n=1 Tax=Chromohalobacter israelensis (strain ATCC BAA-138 / DSM 3043 / CIP 106854 / NCIMB 13768 / 1H11) TaxID=290398 RepID=Q1QXA5_CHRI1|nr:MULTISPECIES: DUF493 domain-containing protein [Chromohalobacter]ABE58903.1 protein of unknown function DUF493 [Chromohalobacter salexigens DSM 3043]MBZ5877220.1 DUF493 domain-containing protein [Chromohalobacter salexigens]MDF9433639.1 DUF493 domain-containing protein [Chromohalobacter israelensis]MDO0944985.1 DUF493 domain-containing protein [Chromohalobacter salexigens]NQY44490.1 DUF493 domain-containing protein [Chromohalobacter sp.]